jgi:hypothetical protein
MPSFHRLVEGPLFCAPWRNAQVIGPGSRSVRIRLKAKKASVVLFFEPCRLGYKKIFLGAGYKNQARNVIKTNSAPIGAEDAGFLSWSVSLPSAPWVKMTRKRE